VNGGRNPRKYGGAGFSAVTIARYPTLLMPHSRARPDKSPAQRSIRAAGSNMRKAQLITADRESRTLKKTGRSGERRRIAAGDRIIVPALW